MACSNPWFRSDVYRQKRHGMNIDWRYKDVQLPCGYCLNCRKDKQNYYIDRANYEYCHRLTASFVTFTYSDIWLPKLAVTDSFGSPIFDVEDGEKKLRVSLDYSDLVHFIDSIRHYIVSHPEIQGVLCQPDFSYLYCGEYGDMFGRPHFHVLFFGLDFAYCKKLIFDRWQFGFIDCLPLLDGGIRYVCKYMDKQTFGVQAEYAFDLKGIARPRIRMSKGFGKGLLLDNAKDIVDHDYTYPIAHGMRRPVSSYWKSLLHGNVLSRNKTKHEPYREKMRIRTAQLMCEYNLHRKCDVTDPVIQNSFRLDQAKIREHNLEIQIRNAGFPVEEVQNIRFSKYGYYSYDHDKILKIPIDIQRILADNYRQSLPYGDDIPF